MKYSLLICEVPHGRADSISTAAVNAGSFGGSVCMGRRISASGFASMLGLGGSTVDIIYIVVEGEKKDSIYSAIQKECENEKPNFGILFSTGAGTLLKNGNEFKGEEEMSETTHELITVILNRGYADDAMAAARKAGAGGGTVINARGTAREDDEKFFGVHIVPEKEMLLIVVDKEKKDAVFEAIRTLPCLKEPGSGITFSQSADSFTILGRKS